MKYKKELTLKEMQRLLITLQNYFIGKTFIDHRGKIKIIEHHNFEDTFGLAYISSGDYAIYTLSTNENIYSNDIPGFFYDRATIAEDGSAYVILTDNEENEYEIKI